MSLTSDRSWLLAAAYFAVALASLWASRSSSGRLERLFWWWVGFSLLVFGLAKQFRVQGTVSDWMRTEARAVGLYEHRKAVEYPFLVIVAVAALFIVICVWRRFARCGPAIATAGLAFLLLTAFLLVRAASVHAIDPLMYKPMLGLISGWWAELGFLLVIAAAAALSPRERSPT
jgi:hypothetical protein